jgi:hypothetical protein
MNDHVGFANDYVRCGSCMLPMKLDPSSQMDYNAGKPIQWRVYCTSHTCPHLGLLYEVQPSVTLKAVTGV